MASTVLPNGIIIPEKYSRDWYADLYHNWEELDNLLGGGTPKDGTLTIQKNGTTLGTFSANQATNETIDIAVPDVNNGALTIQQNGTNVDTFTANSSTDKTVNIQCVDLNSNQTVAGNKEFTGTTTAHDVVPSATDTYNFGSSTAQWNNAYIKSLTINGVVCGDILTHNASEFVNVSGNQTIGGVKTFTDGGCTFWKQIKINHDLEYGTNNPPSTSAYHNLMFTDANGWWGGYLENVTDTSGNSTLALYVRNTNDIQSRVYLKSDINGSFSMYPLSNNVWNLGTSTNKWANVYAATFNGNVTGEGALALQSKSGTSRVYVRDDNASAYPSSVNLYSMADNTEYGVFLVGSNFFPNINNRTNLGTSTNKWKTINGINPGALSLWSNNYISLDTTGFDVTATTIGAFTATVDGWAILSMSQKNKPFGIWLIGGSIRESFYSVKNNDDYFIFALIPVRTNVNMTIYCAADDIDSTRKIDWLRLSPCKGNV